MEITEILEKNISQICLEGRFDANTSDKVESFIWERIKKGIYNIVLNMEKVSFIASAGLRVVLITSRELRKEHKGDLRIACLQPNVKKIFEISGLNSVLHIFSNAEQAMQSFN